MAKIAGFFKATIDGVEVSFLRIGETYKTVEGPSGLSSRKVVEWEARFRDEELGDIARSLFVLPRTSRARLVEEYECKSQGIVY